MEPLRFADERDPRRLTLDDVANFRRAVSFYLVDVVGQIPNAELRAQRYAQLHDALYRAGRTAEWLHAEALKEYREGKR